MNPPAGDGAALVVEGLGASRGERPLFGGLHFAVERGSALLLRGRNGSGKSTLLRGLLGLATTDAGQLTVAGDRFEPRTGRLRPHALYLGHASGLKPEMPASQALAFAAALDRSPDDRQAVDAALQRLGLGRRAQLACRQLSQGQRQRLALGRLLLADAAPRPRALWLLDEPQAALDSDGATLLGELLAAHLGAGGSAIVATHAPVPGVGDAAPVLDLSAGAP